MRGRKYNTKRQWPKVSGGARQFQPLGVSPHSQPLNMCSSALNTWYLIWTIFNALSQETYISVSCNWLCNCFDSACLGSCVSFTSRVEKCIVLGCWDRFIVQKTKSAIVKKKIYKEKDYASNKNIVVLVNVINMKIHIHTYAYICI